MPKKPPKNTPEYYEYERKMRRAAEMKQRKVSTISIDITWTKSGSGIADALVFYKDGTYEKIQRKCGGSGFDKESALVSEVFAGTLAYKLWDGRVENTPGDQIPYGIGLLDTGPDKTPSRYFTHGVGVGCYGEISKFLGGEFVCRVSRPQLSMYYYEDKED